VLNSVVEPQVQTREELVRFLIAESRRLRAQNATGNRMKQIEELAQQYEEMAQQNEEMAQENEEMARIMQYSDEAMMANNGVQTLRALSGFGGNNLPQSPAQSPAASLREAVVTTATAVTSSAAAAAASTTTEEP